MFQYLSSREGNKSIGIYNWVDQLKKNNGPNSFFFFFIHIINQLNYQHVIVSVCFVDGIWKASNLRSCQGWILTIGDRILHLGLKRSYRCLSPLHGELEALLWAMKCLSSLSLNNDLFVTDCTDLIAMTSSPEDWPTFASKLEDFLVQRKSFVLFSLQFISRKNNTRTDLLAKCERTRGFRFSYVGSTVPDWLPLEESLSP